ncbi:Serine/threonine-protein kinase PknF [Bremerella volcania]|uniref:Serine/threonine-protein kinase PknF n=1 Tax=Bremerella volcania TaxID=2527984 RepID=A0A518C9K3_9BACT|nr:WD40 repeat domain-containing serine/threonine protein kinase [Bremerella volcania]QDU75913.1 Serine/threonine-protein kinase PknF [Bremerella volcania]
MFNKGDKPIPGYRLQRFLGRGQFGEVWAADGPGGTLVALKFIALQQKTGIRELKSIQAVKRIKHANLCSVNAMWLLGYDGDVLDDHEIDLLIRNQTKEKEAASQTLAIEQTQTLSNPQYLVVSMTLADGSLDERLKSFTEGGIPRDQLMDYMLQAARGIDFLNSPVHDVAGEKVGIQHRDIKPANLLFAGDSVLVGDFGVAAAFGEYDTEATSVVGSLCYMSPESIKRIPSSSSDQYALAITYYQLRTGTLPFEPTVSFAELVDIHVRGKLQFPLVSDHERAVLSKATATDPKQRYRNCVEFAKALAVPVEVADAGAKSAVPVPAMLGGAIAAVVLIGLLLWGIFGGGFGGTGGASNGPQLASHTIVFSPEQTIYDIAITAEQPRENVASTGTSAANLDLLPTDKVRVTARSEDWLYQPLDKEYSFDELARADWKVNLEPIPAKSMLEHITKLAAQGKWDEATREFAKAAALHPELKDKPSPESVELKGTPAVVTHSLVQKRLATAISDDGSSKLGVVPLNEPGKNAEDVAIGSIPYQIHLPTQAPWAVLMQDSSAAVVSLDASGKPYEISLGKPGEALFRQVTSSALSPRGDAILVGQDHKMVSLLTAREADQPITKSAESSFPTRVDAVGFSPDGKFCFAMGIDGDIRRWPVEGFGDATAKDFQVADLDEEVLAIHPISQDRLFAFTETKLLDIQLADSDTNAQSKLVTDLRSGLVVSRLTDDQKYLVYSTQGQSQPLSILSVETGEVTSIRPPDIKGLVEDFDVSSDGRWIVYVDTEGAMLAIDLTQQPLAPLPLLPSPGERLKFVRIASSTMDVVTLAEDGTTTWWNLAQLLLAAQAKASH